jgi:hypothetical protein
MSRRRVVLAVLAGLMCFGLGVGATRLLGWGPPASAPPAASAGDDVALPWLQKDAGLRLMMPVLEGEGDGGGKEPRILFDPDSINLLPDASLHLDPALVGDAGDP